MILILTVFEVQYIMHHPGQVAQSVACLTADMCLTAGPGIQNLIPARDHTFVGIDREIISTAILLPSADSRELLSVTS